MGNFDADKCLSAFFDFLGGSVNEEAVGARFSENLGKELIFAFGATAVNVTLGIKLHAFIGRGNSIISAIVAGGFLSRRLQPSQERAAFGSANFPDPPKRKK